jgi:hypothetical protein
MANLLKLGLFLLIISPAVAQTNVQGGNVIFSSEFINIAYAPKDVLQKMLLSVKKFSSGKEGIEFSFVIRPVKEMPEVNPDSIILTSADFKILAIHRPVFDSTYALMNLDLSYNSVHWLEDGDIGFLKEEMISDITIFVNRLPATIRLNKKTQKQLRDIMRTNL